jgi:hypothetical protein
MSELLQLELTITLSHLAQVYLTLVLTQILGVTYPYINGRGKKAFHNWFVGSLVAGTVLAYLVLVHGPVL